MEWALDNSTTGPNSTGPATLNPTSISVKELLLHCLLLALSSLLAWVHYNYHAHEIPPPSQNVMTTCSAHLAQSINLEVWLLFVPVLVRLVQRQRPVSLLAAQLIEVLLSANGGALTLMAATLPLLKILLVTRFDWVYAQDPQQVGGWVVRLVYLLTYAVSFAAYWPELRSVHTYMYLVHVRFSLINTIHPLAFFTVHGPETSELDHFVLIRPY